MDIYIVQVHMIHKTVSVPFNDRNLAQEYFDSLVDECVKKYGPVDSNGASAEHCKAWGRYEITKGYFLQIYPTQLNRREEIRWL